MTGRFSSSENIRNQGRENIARADQQVREARGIRESVDAVKAFYQTLAADMDSSPCQTIKDSNGAEMQARIIGLYDGCVIVRKQGSDEFAGIGFKHLHPSCVETVAEAVRQVTGTRVTSSLPAAGVQESANGGPGLELIAEMPAGICVRDAAGKAKVIQSVSGDSVLDGGFRARKEKELAEQDQEIADLKQEMAACAPEARASLKLVYTQCGEPKSFVVQRILSFAKFQDLEEYGKYIYQVRIGGNPTILVTRQTQYLTSGIGLLLLEPAGNHDVIMMDGTTRTVPALVEVDQEIVDRARALQDQIAAAEADFKESIVSATKERGEISDSLRILKENQSAIERIDEDLKAARALAGK